MLSSLIEKLFNISQRGDRSLRKIKERVVPEILLKQLFKKGRTAVQGEQPWGKIIEQVLSTIQVLSQF